LYQFGLPENDLLGLRVECDVNSPTPTRSLTHSVTMSLACIDSQSKIENSDIGYRLFGVRDCQ